MTEQLVVDRCPFCRKDVLMEDLYLHEITGWESERKQGGANVIHLRQRTGKKAHRVCVDKAKQGRTDQAPLF
jgi:hypothetical protein